MHNIIDKKKLIEEKNKAFETWEKNFIFSKFSKILFQKIVELKPRYKNVLLITSDLDETANEVSRIKCKNFIYLSQYNCLLKRNLQEKSFNKVFAFFDKIPIRNNSIDLVICNFCINNIEDKKSYLSKLYNILSDDGLFICNFFGEQTLDELKYSFIEADEKFYKGSYTRIPQNIRMADFSNFISNIGFKEIVTEKVNYEVFYKNILSLLKDIRATGESNIYKYKRKPISKSYLKYTEQIYKKKFKLKASIDIISVSSWKNMK